MEPASDPREWSDMLLPEPELDLTSADGVEGRVSGRDGLTRPARGLVRFLYSSNLPWRSRWSDYSRPIGARLGGSIGRLGLPTYTADDRLDVKECRASARTPGFRSELREHQN